MQIFRAMEASASALTAERLRMDLISNNIANINTTRTAAGTAYRRRFAEQAERVDSFQDVLSRQTGATALPDSGAGVRITAIREDQSPFKLKYDPANPDADARGMVKMPNVDLVQEMTDMMMSTRVYEANVTAFNAAKGMAMKALEIGR